MLQVARLALFLPFLSAFLLHANNAPIKSRKKVQKTIKDKERASQTNGNKNTNRYGFLAVCQIAMIKKPARNNGWWITEKQKRSEVKFPDSEPPLLHFISSVSSSLYVWKFLNNEL